MTTNVYNISDYAQAAHMFNAAEPLPSVSVFGLGYVGAVSTACLAELGVRVYGVDPDARKVEKIASGQSPIVEHELDELLAQGVEEGLISATSDAEQAVLATSVSFVSVGTPTAPDGGCDMTYVRAVGKDIGLALAKKYDFHTIVMRCSIPPGTTLEVLAPEVERWSGKRLGVDFGVCFNPEFLREGVAVADFRDPPKTVIGASDERAAKMLSALYASVDPDPIVTSIAVAEMVKYVDNVWHATKVSFANEVGRLAKPLEIDSHEVMNIFVQDEKLNLSPYYLKPGFAFGGSCLPKEVRAVGWIAENLGVQTPLIDSLLTSNEAQIAAAEEMVLESGAKSVAFLGLTFKPDTNDLRESPFVTLAARLHAQGIEVRVFDPNLSHDDLHPSALAALAKGDAELTAFLKDLPERMIEDGVEAAETADTLVVSHATNHYREICLRRDPKRPVIDLARLWRRPPSDAGYQGVGW